MSRIASIVIGGAIGIVLGLGIAALAGSANALPGAFIAQCPPVLVYLDPGRIVAQHTHEDTKYNFATCEDTCYPGRCLNAHSASLETDLRCDELGADQCICQDPKE